MIDTILALSMTFGVGIAFTLGYMWGAIRQTRRHEKEVNGHNTDLRISMDHSKGEM